MRPQSHPHATPRLPQSANKAPTKPPRGEDARAALAKAVLGNLLFCRANGQATRAYGKVTAIMN